MPGSVLIISGTNRPQSNAMKVAKIIATAYSALGNVVAISAAVPFTIGNTWPLNYVAGLSAATGTPVSAASRRNAGSGSGRPGARSRAATTPQSVATWVRWRSSGVRSQRSRIASLERRESTSTFNRSTTPIGRP